MLRIKSVMEILRSRRSLWRGWKNEWPRRTDKVEC